MKNIRKCLIYLILLVLVLSLSGFTTTPNDVLKLFKNMKIESIKYCQLEIDGPTLTVNNKFQQKDLIFLVKLLNNIKGVNQKSFPAPKGIYIGFILSMKSKKDITFVRVNNNLGIYYNNERYTLNVPGYDSFFTTMYKKYSK